MASTQEQAAIRAILPGTVNPCVVELGAHCGEDEPWIRDACGDKAVYVMVEPDPRNVQVILSQSIEWSRRGITPEWRRIVVGAIYSEAGWQQFHMSDNAQSGDHGSGSLRKPTGHIAAMPWITFPKTTTVPCYTLDSIFETQWLSKIDLLWVDLQGSEREMILGGEKALRHSRYLFIEVEEVELYEGEALKPELVSMLEQRGWHVMRDFGFNVLLANDRFTEMERR